MAAPCEIVRELLKDVALQEQTSDYMKNDASVRDIIEKLTCLCRQKCYREALDENAFQCILQILTATMNETDHFSRNPTKPAQYETTLQLTTECFRCLRNACIQCPENQSIIRSIGLIDAAIRIVQSLHVEEGVHETLLLNALRCGLQFLGNAASGNRESQDCIWKHAFPSLFLNYLNHADEKASAYCSMVLYSCLDDQKLKDLQNNANGLNVALSAVRVCGKQPDLDWAIWIVTDYFLTSPELVEAIYSRMTSQERIFFLELIIAKLGEKKCGTDAISANTDIPLKLVEFLAHCFQENCKAVLCFAADAAANENEEALVVVRLLDCLCEISSCHEKYECLQTQPGLLEDAIEILQQTHLIGKLGGNVFSISHSPSRVEQVLHPAEGFKAHVIRLIGNLCYRNRENQDRVRTLDGIPLILDNCSIDDNNPFMNQWAVFAIRNLTEHNRENQEVISKMDRLGLADTSFLRSMGLDVQEREGTLMLKSLKKGQ